MENYNQFTPAKAERLALLIEEMGEAIQIAGKILRHGYWNYHPNDLQKKPNRTLLAEEIGHVKAAIQMLIDKKDISECIIEESSQMKRVNVKKWLHHQEEDLT